MSRIISLTVANFKRLTAARVPLKAGVNRIAGQNGAGKSSVLDAVAAALSGREIPDKPIHEGAKNAEIVVETDQIVITRRFTASGSTLVVENKDRTSKFSKPQDLLEKLTGGPNARLFDPSRFIRQSETPDGRTAQRIQLQALVGMDFTKLDADKKRLTDERLIVNREAASAKSAAAAMPQYSDAPAAEKSATEILAEIEKANTHNASVDQLARAALDAKAKVDASSNAITRAEGEIADLEAKLTAAKAKLRSVKMERLDAEEAMTAAQEAAKVEKKDTTELRKQLQDCEATNAKVRANAAREAEANKAFAKEQKSTQLTDAIAALEKQKKDALAAAKFPIDGLSFDETGVLYKGQPFAQASDAEKLRVAVGICAAMKPELRVMVIRHGSLFDSTSMELLEELCEQYDVQCLVEIVADEGEAPAGAIEIVDGTTKASSA